MGLDIYLYGADNKRLFGFVKGVRADGTEGYVDTTPKDPIYPEHYCNTYYLRSSYNSSGFNSVMEDLGLPSLYEVFAYKEDLEVEFPTDDPDYDGKVRLFVPDWDACLERTKQLQTALAAKGDTYRSEFVGAGCVNPAKIPVVNSEKEATAEFEKALADPSHAAFRSYSSGLGRFALDGMQIFAAIGGYRGSIFSDIQKEAGVYLIYKMPLEWYSQMTDIIVRFCENGKELNARMYWSG